MLRWLSLLCLLLCLQAWAGVPEIPRFRVLGVTDGLPSTSIPALARDRDGYLWLATWDGVARYDGVDFKVWRHEPDDPASLPGNVAQALHIDAGNRIWVATESSGLSMMGPDRNGFTHFRMASHPQMDSDDVFAITSHGDDVWFGTFGGGIYRIDARLQLTALTVPPDLMSPGNSSVIAMAFDGQGRLLVGTMSGLRRYDGKRMEAIETPCGVDVIIYSINRDGDTIWLGTSKGVYQWRADGSWYTPPWSGMFARPNAVNAIVPDNSGEYWLASQRGLWRTRGEAAAEPAVPEQLQSRVIQAILRQQDGGMWVPLPTVGLGYLRSDWRLMASFTTAQGLSGGLYRGIAASDDGGGLWLASSNGNVEYLDIRSGDISQLEGFEDRLGDIKLTSAFQDSRGKLWLGYRGGLLRLDPASRQLLRWEHGAAPNDSGVPDTSAVEWLKETPDGSLWLATQLGAVQRRDLATGKVLETTAPAVSQGGMASEVDTLLIGADGLPWLVSGNGLQYWDADKHRFRSVDGTRGERIFGFAFDGPDYIWLHRLSGLEGWQRQRGSWALERRIQHKEGLPAVESTGMVIDPLRRIWLATRRGLFRIQPGLDGKHPQIRGFGVRDGLSSQEFNDRGLLLTRDGVLAGSTADGAVMVLDTRQEDPPVVRPNLVVDNVTLPGGEHPRQLPSNGGFALNHDMHEFQVSMRLMSFEDPVSNRYRSWLQGFDSGWVDQGPSGERVFSSLPPGRYRLLMQGYDEADNASVVRHMDFRVMPPWWRSGWGITLVSLLVLLVLLAMALGYRRRVRRRAALQLAEHKRSLAEQASLAKTRFLATLGHEVRTPMTGVMGMSELLLATPLNEKQRHYTSAIQRAGGHLLRLVNDALDLARIEAGKLELEPQPFNLRQLLEEVASLTRPMAEKKGLAYIELFARDLPAWVHGDPMRLRQILLNLVGNAIKFTEKGQVELSASRFGEVIRLVVGDTGPGINAEQQSRLFQRFEQADGARTAARYGGSGLGLAISQELAVAMGGRVTVESTPGLGTRFHADLPLPEVPAPASAQRRERPAGGSQHALLVLLVEDDVTVAEVVSGLLEGRGHRVVHASNGLAALREAAGTRFDLALLDLDLPGLDGLALARQLRLGAFTAPLMAITARTDGEAEAQAQAAGFTCFLRKPVTGDMLAEALESLPTDTGMAAQAPAGDVD